MSLPDQMTDRWQNRPEPPPGEGVVSWHLLMRDYPEVVELARQAQQRLAGFDGLQMTPLRWLHVTMLLAGPAADFSPNKLRQMTQTAADLLADTPAAAVTLGQILYHPEAVMLGVTPAETLTATMTPRARQPIGSRGACTGWPARALEAAPHDLLQHL